jgi:hypothetical protein
MTTMTIAILLYIALSLLAMIIIFGACLVAARADSATDAKKGRPAHRAQSDTMCAMEQSSQKMGDVI